MEQCNLFYPDADMNDEYDFFQFTNPTVPLENYLFNFVVGHERTTLIVTNKGITNLIDASKRAGAETSLERTQ
jgi:hypothetical protein